MKLPVLLITCGLALASAACLAADATAAPAAAAAKPMRVVVQISDNDAGRWNLALNNVRNVQKELGADKIEMEVVAFGPGLNMLKDDSVVADRVREATAAGIHFEACRNTMKAMQVTEADIIPGVGFVKAGVVEIIEKQQQGYAYLRP